MPSAFDPYYEWLGIAPKDQPPNHYRLLGLDTFEPSPEAIANAAEQRTMLLRSRQMGKHSEVSQRLLNEVSAARVVLIQADKKADYDDSLRRSLAAMHGTDATGIDAARLLAPPISPPAQHAIHTPSRPAARTPPQSLLPWVDWENPLPLIGVALGGVLVLLLCGIGVAVLMRDFSKPLDPVAKRPSPRIVSVASPPVVKPAPRPLPAVEPAPAPVPVIEPAPTPPPVVEPAPAQPPAMTNSLGMQLAYIPPGEFQMGSPETELGRYTAKEEQQRERQHRVRIIRGFHLGTTEVTQVQWKAVMETEPWKGERFVREGANYAASYVSWSFART